MGTANGPFCHMKSPWLGFQVYQSEGRVHCSFSMLQFSRHFEYNQNNSEGSACPRGCMLSPCWFSEGSIFPLASSDRKSVRTHVLDPDLLPSQQHLEHVGCFRCFFFVRRSPAISSQSERAVLESMGISPLRQHLDYFGCFRMALTPVSRLF